MDGAREKRGGRKRVEEGRSNGASERSKGGAWEPGTLGGRKIGREGNFKGVTLRRTLASILHTVYSAQNNTQRGPCHCDFGKYKIVNGYINSVL